MLNLGRSSTTVLPLLQQAAQPMSQAIALLVVGGGIGLVSALLGAFFQHWLALKRAAKEREEKLVEDRREKLSLERLTADDIVRELVAAKALRSAVETGREPLRKMRSGRRMVTEGFEAQRLESRRRKLVIAVATIAALCFVPIFCHWVGSRGA